MCRSASSMKAARAASDSLVASRVFLLRLAAGLRCQPSLTRCVMSKRPTFVRIFRSMLNNYKVHKLPDRLHRAWINCLLSADVDGVLPKIEYLSYELRVSDEEALALTNDLIEARFIDVIGGKLVMHEWDEHQHGGRPPLAEWKVIRQRIFARDDYTCAYCGERGGKLHCDHIHPVAHGGGHDDENLITSCEPCNRAKRSKIVSVEQWRSIRGGKS